MKYPHCGTEMTKVGMDNYLCPACKEIVRIVVEVKNID